MGMNLKTIDSEVPDYKTSATALWLAFDWRISAADTYTLHWVLCASMWKCLPG